MLFLLFMLPEHNKPYCHNVFLAFMLPEHKNKYYYNDLSILCSQNTTNIIITIFSCFLCFQKSTNIILLMFVMCLVVFGAPTLNFTPSSRRIPCKNIKKHETHCQHIFLCSGIIKTKHSIVIIFFCVLGA